MAASDDQGADAGGARQPGRPAAVPRLFRWLRRDGRRPSREYAVPSWARWIAASLAVVIDWLVNVIQASSGSYAYLLLFIALMLYPDAQVISVGGLRFERLRGEVDRQNAQIAALNLHVQHLTAISQAHQEVTIKIAAGEQAPSRPWAAAAAQYRAASQEAQWLLPPSRPVDVSSEGEHDGARPRPPGAPGRRPGGPDSP
jgi:hypothetical protein